MVLDDESKLRESFHPYDKRVAGVISGAGNYKPLRWARLGSVPALLA